MGERIFSGVRVGAVALAVLAVLLLAGCGGGGSGGSSGGGETEGTPEAGGTLHLAEGEEVITLDPLMSTDEPSINVGSQINETLFKVNAKNENEPWLVSNAKASKNQTVWTFQLRPKVEFSNGQPLTSADVLFTLELARKSTIWGTLFENVVSVKAPSSSAVVVTSSKPAPELPAVLSQWSFGIMPKNYGGETEKEFAQHPIGTGPFMLESWKRGESLTLAKNPHYWDTGKPILDKVVVQSIPNPQSRVAQLQGGQLELINAPPWAQIESIESSPETTVGNFPLGLIAYVTLNSQAPIFQNQHIREAVKLAIDREGIVKAALNGKGEVAGSWIPPVLPFADKSIKPASQDLEKAKALVAEAIKEGADPNFSILTNSEDPIWAGSGVQILQQNLEEVGFKVKLQPLENAAYIEVLESGKYDMGALRAYSAVPTPLELIGYYNGFGGVWTGAPTDRTEQIGAEAAAEVNVDKRRDLYNEFQEILDEEGYVLPVAYAPFAWAMRTNVSGFQVSVTGVPWLAETGLSG